MKDYKLFPPHKLRKYPHLMVTDVAIWERFIEKHGKKWDSFAYDVRVGEGVSLSEAEPQEIKTMARALWEKRIDVIGVKGNETFIIEVKPSAMLSAIGQVLSYEVLYRDRYKDVAAPKKMIVTDRAGPDLLRLCREYNIDAVVV